MVRLDSTLYARSGFIRGGYSTENYSELISEMHKPENQFSGFNALNKWLLVETHEFFVSALGMLEFFFYPYLSAFHAKSGIGTYFIFVPEQAIEYQLGSFPRDYLDFVRSDSELAKNLLADNPDKSNIHSKYFFAEAPSTDDYLEFLMFYLTKLEGLIYDLFNICNYRDETDANKVDPVYAFEYNITFLHILKMTLSLIHSKESYNNKNITFQIADMYDAICNNAQLGIPDQDTELFKRLFNKDYFESTLMPILESSTIRLKPILIQTMEAIYNELNQTMLDSVWLSYRISGRNISVKNKEMTANNTEAIEKFSANAIRSLRNTHHGYLSRYDKQKRPSRYLSMITGEIPGSFPSLSFFWLLCLLTDKEKFIGTP